MTDWETRYQEGNTPWDKGMASPPLSAWVRTHTPYGRALVPGCGTGHDVALLAEAGVDVIGIDLAATAIKQACTAYPAHATRFRQHDLFALPQEWDCSFDFLFEHTCFCAIPTKLRPAYAETAARLLKPGGRLVGVWFINPEMDPGEVGPPFGTPIEELDRLFPHHLWKTVEDHTPQVAHEGRQGRERLRVMEKLS